MQRNIKSLTLGIGLICCVLLGQASQGEAAQILIHMKTSLAEDDAQICAVPNVAWAMVKAGHQVKILVDASAVTSVTKGFGWFNSMFRSDTTALDRAALPEGERQSLSEQMGISLEKVPHHYGDYFHFLKSMGVAEQLEKRLIVRGTAEDRLASSSTIHHMIDSARISNAQGTSHADTITDLAKIYNNRLDPYSNNRLDPRIHTISAISPATRLGYDDGTTLSIAPEDLHP